MRSGSQRFYFFIILFPRKTTTSIVDRLKYILYSDVARAIFSFEMSELESMQNQPYHVTSTAFAIMADKFNLIIRQIKSDRKYLLHLMLRIKSILLFWFWNAYYCSVETLTRAKRRGGRQSNTFAHFYLIFQASDDACCKQKLRHRNKMLIQLWSIKSVIKRSYLLKWMRWMREKKWVIQE